MKLIITFAVEQIARMVLSLTRREIAEIKTQGKRTANGKQRGGKQVANSKQSERDVFVRTDPTAEMTAGYFVCYLQSAQLTVCCLLFTVCSHGAYSDHSSSGFQ